MTDTQEQSMWATYYEKAAGWGPSWLLLRALELYGDGFPQPRYAVDLGCGEGSDTRELLKRDWYVFAIDSEPKAIELLLNHKDTVNGNLLRTLCDSFETAQWRQAQLVNASKSIWFSPPDKFQVVWQRIVNSLVPGGLFVGDFLGERDDWAKDSSHTHFSQKALLDLLDPDFEVLFLSMLERDGLDALQRTKHQHHFNIMAKRRSP